MEPTKEQLEEWWQDKERVWQQPLALSGPQMPSGVTGYCIRGGRYGPLCLHLDHHGAGLFGENVIATNWGGYMHVECAVQSLRELENVGWEYSGPVFEKTDEVGKDEGRIGTEGDMFEGPKHEPEPVTIELDVDTPSGVTMEGAQLEEVLTDGTQAELLVLIQRFAGQPMFTLAKEIPGVLRLGRKTYRYFAWKVVE